MASSDPDSKVLFRVPEDDGPAQVETLWATALGQDKYRIENSPFFAYSVSWLDVVYAPEDEVEGFPTFMRVVEKSGHRTIRVIFDPPVESGNESEMVLNKLTDLGCTFETANPAYVAIDVPPGGKFDETCRCLIESGVQWEHANPRYSELYPDDA